MTATPELPEPFLLRVWPSIWRLVVCLISGYLLWFWNYQPIIEDPVALQAQHSELLAELGVMLLASPAVLIRHSHPRLALALSAVGSLYTAACFPLLWVTFECLAERRRNAELYGGTAVFMLASVVNSFWIGDFVHNPRTLGMFAYWLLIVLLEAMLCVALLSIGISRGSHRELLESLRSGAELTRREQSARIAQAKLTERARIAREMHDVLAHKISLISLHAGVLAYQDDLSDDERRQTATLIQETSHQALEELREVLGVLRSDEIGANAKPQPSLLDLPALIAEEEAAGTLVTLDIPSDFWLRAGTLGPNTTRHAHRIVQEALTNARKHAGGQPVDIRVGGDERAGLDIYVHNRVGDKASTVPGSGLGLPGLLERAQLAGGTLEATHSPTDFTIYAHLPWDARIGS